MDGSLLQDRLDRSGSGRQFLDAMIKDRHAPKDAYLTKGASFIETSGVIRNPKGLRRSIGL